MTAIIKLNEIIMKLKDYDLFDSDIQNKVNMIIKQLNTYSGKIKDLHNKMERSDDPHETIYFIHQSILNI